MNKTLFEYNLNEAEPQVEPSAGNLGDTTPAEFADASHWAAKEVGSVYPTVSSTDTSDIAKTEPKVGFAGSIASRTLPAVLGYTQPMGSPSGFVFAMKKDAQDDMQITRKSVTTGLREVTLDFTDEVIHDIEQLFGPEFGKNYKEYLFYDGTDIDFKNPFETSTQTASGDYEQTQDGKLAEFFINFATWRMSRETNIEFGTWVSSVATDMGTFTVADGSDFYNLKAGIGEMKSKLYETTQKTGRVWVLSDPKTIGYLGMARTSCAPDSPSQRNGKRIPTGSDYNYAFTCGETDYYHDINIPVGEIYVGLSGGPGESSIYYTPYKEYFIGI